jgi:Tfp pilus assembly protein PilE
MGQQQLLLVILVTIIVGIATVVAINTFSSAADSANVDAVRNDLTSMAAAAQGYYMKPSMMGGGGQDFTNITWDNMGSVPVNSTSATEASNDNGSYTISGRSAGQFDIEATPNQAGGNIFISVCPDTASVSSYDEAGGATAPGC